MIQAVPTLMVLAHFDFPKNSEFYVNGKCMLCPAYFGTVAFEGTIAFFARVISASWNKGKQQNQITKTPVTSFSNFKTKKPSHRLANNYPENEPLKSPIHVKLCWKPQYPCSERGLRKQQSFPPTRPRSPVRGAINILNVTSWKWRMTIFDPCFPKILKCRKKFWADPNFISADHLKINPPAFETKASSKPKQTKAAIETSALQKNFENTDENFVRLGACCSKTVLHLQMVQHARALSVFCQISLHPPPFCMSTPPVTKSALCTQTH